MLDFNEARNQLAMAISVNLYGHILRREDINVRRRALNFQAVS